ncbi:MAG: hypothetical protein WBW81_09185 [Methylocella sp.]
MGVSIIKCPPGEQSARPSPGARRERDLVERQRRAGTVLDPLLDRSTGRHGLLMGDALGVLQRECGSSGVPER